MKAAIVLLAALPALVRADGIGVVLTDVSIPPQTLALIDPLTGTSIGGAADMRLGPGDIITARFHYVPVPDSNATLDGMQSYLTVYVPANAELVGARILSDASYNAIAVAPGWPGISVDAASGSSLAQVYADTGVFVASVASLARNPTAEFLRFDDGIDIVEPVQATNIAPIIGAYAADVRAHNAWDAENADAFGGGGLTPLDRGSPVAGNSTHYANDSTAAVGPWSRVRYRGSLIGYDPPGNTEVLRRTAVDASELGFDLSPLDAAQAPAAGARAVRFALGDLRIGRPGVVEVALRVVQTPLESGPASMNDNVVCAEIFGGDSAKRSETTTGTGAVDNAWATFVPAPACAYLRLAFDLDVDNELATAGQKLTWTLSGRNLSLVAQSNAQVYLGYDTAQGSVLTIQPPPAANAVPCPAQLGAGLTCIRWDLGALAEAAAFTNVVTWNVGAGGASRNTFRALFESDQLPAPGQLTQQIALVQPVPVFNARATLGAAMVAAGADMPVSATYANSGTGAATMNAVGVFAPEGWTIGAINVAGGAIECGGLFTTEAHCTTALALAAGASTPLTFTVTPPPEAAAGLYPVHIDLWASASGIGGETENLFPEVVTVPVGLARTAPPSVSCPIPVSADIIGGTSAGGGDTVRIYFDRSLRGSTSGTPWSYTDFTATFGALYGGMEVRATAQATGELESELSEPCVVGRVPDAIFASGFEG